MNVAAFALASLVPEAGTDVNQVPYNNLGVYMAAGKFGIYALKDLARNRLPGWLKYNSDKEDFEITISVFCRCLTTTRSSL